MALAQGQHKSFGKSNPETLHGQQAAGSNVSRVSRQMFMSSLSFLRTCQHKRSGNHKRLGLEGTFKGRPAQPLCDEQGHLPPAQLAWVVWMNSLFPNQLFEG